VKTLSNFNPEMRETLGFPFQKGGYLISKISNPRKQSKSSPFLEER